MKLQTAPPQRQDPVAGHGANRRVTFVTASVLALAWVFGWITKLNWPVVMAMTAVILIVGIAAAAIRAMPWRNGHQPTGPASPALGGERVDPVASSGFSAPIHGKRWSLDVFQSIDAKRFAAVCETWFSWAGFDTRLEAHRTDEGVDIWLHAAKVPGPVAIVRCKHGLNKPVDLRDMQEFIGVIAPYRSVHGTYTTTSTYTPEALQLAKENGIDAVDGPGLLRRIQTRTRQRQQALLAVAFSGHH